MKRPGRTTWQGYSQPGGGGPTIATAPSATALPAVVTNFPGQLATDIAHNTSAGETRVAASWLPESAPQVKGENKISKSFQHGCSAGLGYLAACISWPRYRLLDNCER